MKDQWTDRLSGYLDGDLGVAERGALEAHLAGCPACEATLDELRRVVARAQALEDQPPATDLWPAIAEQIGVSSGAHRVVSLASHSARRARSLPALRSAGSRRQGPTTTRPSPSCRGPSSRGAAAAGSTAPRCACSRR